MLAALGLAITFGLMGVINMAHGEMVMLGAYTTYVVQKLFLEYAPNSFDAYPSPPSRWPSSWSARSGWRWSAA